MVFEKPKLPVPRLFCWLRYQAVLAASSCRHTFSLQLYLMSCPLSYSTRGTRPMIRVRGARSIFSTQLLLPCSSASSRHMESGLSMRRWVRYPGGCQASQQKEKKRGTVGFGRYGPLVDASNDRHTHSADTRHDWLRLVQPLCARRQWDMANTSPRFFVRHSPAVRVRVVQCSCAFPAIAPSSEAGKQKPMPTFLNPHPSGGSEPESVAYARPRRDPPLQQRF